MRLGSVDVAAVANDLEVAERKVLKELGRLVAAGLVDGDGKLVTTVLREIAVSLPAAAPIDPSIVAGPWSHEESAVLSRFFTGRRPVSIPSARSKRRLVLECLAMEFEPGLQYQEPEVNFALQMFHADYASLRRYLVDEGFMERTGGSYWRTGGRMGAAPV